MEVNLVFSLAPKPFTTLMMTSEIPAAIRPYSMAVAPVSSRKNLMNNRMESPDLSPSTFWIETRDSLAALSLAGHIDLRLMNR